MKDILYIILALNCLMVGYHYEYIKKDSSKLATILITIGMLLIGAPGWILLFIYKGIEKALSFLGIINFLTLVPLYLGMYNHLLNNEAVEVLQNTADDLSKKTKLSIKEKSFMFTHKKVIAYINRKKLANGK
jgi:predicted Na+-dependent transporter